jgi:ankyrin repeat protein
MGSLFSKDDNVKYTPLHYAVKMDNVDAAIALLLRGCSIKDKDSNGETVYELCEREGSEKMKKTLALYKFTPMNR